MTLFRKGVTPLAAPKLLEELSSYFGGPENWDAVFPEPWEKHSLSIEDLRGTPVGHSFFENMEAFLSSKGYTDIVVIGDVAEVLGLKDEHLKKLVNGCGRMSGMDISRMLDTIAAEAR